ncbi:MAG: NAD(+) synthase, partial [Muribaculaceae bacterium]|nr:NAD(+) synthase [Muribaculaceae bacterium]
MKNHGFFRAVAAAPAVHIADCNANATEIIKILQDVAPDHPDLVVFPEMCVTGYTCADLFHSTTLLLDAMEALEKLVAASADMDATFIVGMPLVEGGTLYNCAVVIARGTVAGVVPKTYIPNYNEFYEKRWWASAPDCKGSMLLLGDEVPFGTSLLFLVGDTMVGVEICEDLWTPVPPSCNAAMAGAEVVVNLSASDDLIGKYDYLRGLISQQSARCLCGYVYASAGYGESSTDLVFDAKTIIAEKGTTLACGKRWVHGSQWVAADIDLEAIRRDRLHTGSFHDCFNRTTEAHFYEAFHAGAGAERAEEDVLRFRKVAPRPFVPAESSSLDANCDEIINIQVAALCRRLEATRCRSLVVGISGGLDSTLALLVAVAAFDKLSLPRTGITGVTMPGFGTTSRTHDNAVELMRLLGVSMREISIVPAVMQHFSDIDHNPQLHDVTYENSQARQRTLLLMDIANQTGGMVLGTGDLSELALGWATYNGDHMSMYGVNAGVPKTLVAHLVRWMARTAHDTEAGRILMDIADTPISPELLPPTAEGEIAQVTEDLVGPYELHDFFLY